MVRRRGVVSRSRGSRGGVGVGGRWSVDVRRRGGVVSRWSSWLVAVVSRRGVA
ncbi:hypothetical protein ACXZ9C_11650 [Streptococcus agalactiae]